MNSRLLLTALCLLPGSAAAAAAPPTDNPAARYRLPWTDDLRWKNVVNIADVAGDTADERLAEAQRRLAGKGGVVFFPAGVYRFRDHIRLKDGVVLRGEDPAGVTDARKDGYDPPT